MLRIKTLILAILLLMAMNSLINAQNKQIIEFTGDLEPGKTYLAEIKFNEYFNEWQTAKRLKLPYHHAGRIEWSNLNKFYTLRNPKAEACCWIEFKIVSKKVYQAAKNRWNTIYKAKILHLISDKTCRK